MDSLPLTLCCVFVCFMCCCVVCVWFVGWCCACVYGCYGGVCCVYVCLCCGVQATGTTSKMWRWCWDSPHRSSSGSAGDSSPPSSSQWVVYTQTHTQALTQTHIAIRKLSCLCQTNRGTLSKQTYIAVTFILSVQMTNNRYVCKQHCTGKLPMGGLRWHSVIRLVVWTWVARLTTIQAYN